jgi:hypothetical protein
MKYFMENRGRFQAQGRILEESESWAQDESIYHCEGKVLITNLKTKLSPRDFEIRKLAFKQCEEYVDRANKNGGVSGFFTKSFPKNFKERVDLEVHRGVAFKTKPKKDEND